MADVIVQNFTRKLAKLASLSSLWGRNAKAEKKREIRSDRMALDESSQTPLDESQVSDERTTWMIPGKPGYVGLRQSTLVVSLAYLKEEGRRGVCRRTLGYSQ